MPTARIPLVGNINRRPYLAASNTSYDQRFEACFFENFKNQATNSSSLYVVKRPGLLNDTNVSSANKANAIFYSPNRDNFYIAFGGTNSTIYYYTTSGPTNTSLGAVDGLASHFCETILNGVTYVLVSTTQGMLYYHASNAVTSFVGDTHSNTTIDGIASTAGLYVGQLLSGTNIVLGTRIESITSGTAIVVTIATTGTTGGVTVTATAVAKVIDADFPTIIGPIAEMDGYIFVMTAAGRIYNSDLNSVTSWTSTNYIMADSVTDGGMGCVRYKNFILGFGPFSIEPFKNAGNPTGSVLAKAGASVNGIGVSASVASKTTSARTLLCSGHDNVFWISQDGILYTLNGFSPQRLSTEADYQLDVSIGLSTFTLAGHRFVNVSSNTSGDRWFDVESGFLTIPSWGASGTGGIFIAGPNTSHVCYAANGTTSGAEQGRIFKVADSNSAVFQDNGAAYSMIIQTSRWDAGTQKRKIVSKLRIDADTQSSGTLTVEYSDNDYTTWTTWGTIDLTLPKKEITRGGSFTGGRAWRFTHSANTAFRASSLEIDYEVGTA